MKKIWIVIGIIGLAVALGLLIHTQGGEEVPTIPISEPPPITPQGQYLDIPLGESFALSPDTKMDKAIAPAYFEFDSVIPGATIDTWTKGGYVDFGEEKVGWVPGEDLWVLVYNGMDSNVTFTLECVNAPLEINDCGSTGKSYFKAPDGALVSIVFPSTVTIEPMSAMKVPIDIQLPADVDYPDQWEFRLVVSGSETSGLVETNLECRFLATMR